MFMNLSRWVESDLREFDKSVVLTPHLGASTEEAQVNVAIDVAEQNSGRAAGPAGLALR